MKAAGGMADRLTVFAVLAFVGVLVGLGLHIAGLVTRAWFVTDGSSEDHVTIGWWQMETRSGNGSVITSDSPINYQIEHYVIIAVAGFNALLCFFVLVKSVSVCVGIIAFITSALMCTTVVLTYEDGANNVKELRERSPEWASLRLGWSFYLIFTGLLVHILFTACFLTFLLIQGERKATMSSKGLGPEDVHSEKTEGDRTPIVSIISRENYVYENTAVSDSPDSAYPGTSHPEPEIEIIFSQRL